MVAKILPILSALGLATLPAVAAGETLDAPKQDSLTQGRPDTGGGSYGDQNRGGSRGFYGYPSHRSIDGRGTTALNRKFSPTDPGTSPYSRQTHGSAYYGRDYGAPYFGGGYYDDGVYYRERRD
ncbi:hypothetical protein LZ496_12640 [Sphingomonas sp. NSE70-1]|uniref:Uncharacterized protein n=1 Tax=Sphingomonas caseinilyticus TaxID=2908205 RepID=A0ABT0RXE1_9SPHN|nr:hypothetical protein [Sphingomonas caseinilyticus]MCL6699626.1 hypothetical protein [Sphingomonas caseinilyticus]